MPLTKDLREFVECLHSNRVDYLIVGALAVSWHGFPRYSADIDFFVRASPDMPSGMVVNFIGVAAPLRNKAATGRPKDLIDLDALRKAERS